MALIAKLMEVKTNNRLSIPEPNETILTDMKINAEAIYDMKVYFREPEDCPYNRGNWIIDIFFSETDLLCLKLPKEMSKEAVLAYIKPLTDELEMGYEFKNVRKTHRICDKKKSK